MLTLFGQLKGKFKHRKPGTILEGRLAALHHRVTASLIFAFCILVTSRQYIGEPIQCIQSQTGDDAPIAEKVMNTFCFIMTTYTVPDSDLGYGCPIKGEVYGLPGIRPDFSPRGDTSQQHHAYYQWVPLVLFLQATSFLVPHYLWIKCEGGLTKKLLAGIADTELQTISTGENEVIEPVAKYFVDTINTHHFVAFGWLACDFLSLFNAVANFFLTDVFLGGRFIGYGLEVFNFLASAPVHPIECTNPMEDVFPKVTKCTFYKYGKSGTIETHDSLCVMALNVVNEKIYVILWFWFLLLIFLTILGICIKLVVLIILECCSETQLTSLSGALIIQRWILGAPITVRPSRFKNLFKSLSLSDWVFLSFLASNLYPATYKKFISNVSKLLPDITRNSHRRGLSKSINLT